MKVKALVDFRDKVTGTLRKEGSTFEVDDERGKELISDPRNVAEKVVEKKTTTKKK